MIGWLRSGDPVTTYEELVVVLREKSPAIQTAFLDFHGRNQVLYWLPEGV